MTTTAPARPSVTARVAPASRYRIASWAGDISDPRTVVRTVRATTPDVAATKALAAAAEGRTVHLELWDEAHVHDDLNRGWALYDHLAPYDTRTPITPTVTEQG